MEAPPPRHVAGPSLSPPPRIPRSSLSPAPHSPGCAGCGADAARGGVKLQPGQVPAGRKGSLRRTRESRALLWKDALGAQRTDWDLQSWLHLPSLPETISGYSWLGGLTSLSPGFCEGLRLLDQLGRGCWGHSFYWVRRGGGSHSVLLDAPLPHLPLLGLNESRSVARRQNKIKKAQRT